MAAPKLVTAKQTFAPTVKEEERLVHQGDQLRASDPVVKAHPQLFEGASTKR